MPSPTRSLGHQMLRTASVFQGAAALVTGVIQGAWVIDLFFSYSWHAHLLYDAITAITTTLLSAAILFSALVETSPHNGSLSILILEAVKSASASALWVWLVLDSIFGPQRYNNNEEARLRRITLSVVSVLILLIAFYPTLAYAAYSHRKEQRQASRPATDREQQQSRAEGEEDEGERQPLLRS